MLIKSSHKDELFFSEIVLINFNFLNSFRTAKIKMMTVLSGWNYYNMYITGRGRKAYGIYIFRAWLCCFFVFKCSLDFTGNFTYVTVAEMSPQIVEKSNFHVKETLFLISLGKITVFQYVPNIVIFPAFLNISSFYK